MRSVLASKHRSWFFLAIGLIATLLTVAVLPAPRGVYWTQVEVVFVPPKSTSGLNPLLPTSESLVYFVAATERELNGHSTYARAASSTASLYGRGVRSGYEIRLPSSGTQWQGSFNQPQLEVQVVDPDLARAQSQLDAVLTRIETTVQDSQAKAGASQANRVQVAVVPGQPGFTFVTGSHRREQVAVLILGMLLSAGLASAVEARHRRAARGWDHKRASDHRPTVTTLQRERA